jgi:hypothetical protein
MNSDYSWCSAIGSQAPSRTQISVALPGNAAPSIPCSLPGPGSLAAKSVAPNFESDFGDGKSSIRTQGDISTNSRAADPAPGVSNPGSFLGHMITVCHQTS